MILEDNADTYTYLVWDKILKTPVGNAMHYHDFVEDRGDLTGLSPQEYSDRYIGSAFSIISPNHAGPNGTSLEWEEIWELYGRLDNHL